MAENKTQTDNPVETEVDKKPGFIRTFPTKHPRLTAALAGAATVVGVIGAAKVAKSRVSVDADVDVDVNLDTNSTPEPNGAEG